MVSLLLSTSTQRQPPKLFILDSQGPQIAGLPVKLFSLELGRMNSNFYFL